MRPLLRRVPQLHRLGVFDAVATTGGFTAAARDLEISQPAVSRHMTSLAAELGIELFQRSGRSFVLTNSGRALAEAVSSSFASLERVLADLVDDREAFVLAVQPAMATTWVVPLLDQLEEAAGCEIRLRIFDRRSELDSTGWDLAIVPGAIMWHDWESTNLFTEAVRPFASPSLASSLSLNADSEPSELAGANLLYIDDVERPSMTWQEWFVEAGSAESAPKPRLVYNAYPTVIQEALVGNGIALGWRHLLGDLVERGLLVPVGPVVERHQSGQNVCWRSGRADSRHVGVLNRLQLAIQESSISFAK